MKSVGKYKNSELKICSDVCVLIGRRAGCDPNPCHNGGSCTIVSGEEVCSCPSPYYGSRCESKYHFNSNKYYYPFNYKLYGLAIIITAILKTTRPSS